MTYYDHIAQNHSKTSVHALDTYTETRFAPTLKINYPPVDWEVVWRHICRKNNTIRAPPQSITAPITLYKQHKKLIHLLPIRQIRPNLSLTKYTHTNLRTRIHHAVNLIAYTGSLGLNR